MAAETTPETAIAEALRANRAKLLLGAELAQLGYWEYDVATDLVSFDEGLLKLYRTTPSVERHLVRTPADYISEFVAPDDAELFAGQLRAAIAARDPGFTRQFEHRIIRRNKTIGWLAVRYSVVQDLGGRTIKVYGASQDLSERDHAERDLNDSEGRLHQLAENLREVVWMTTVNRDQFLYISAAYERIWGRSSASLYCEPGSWGDALHPDDRTRVLGELQSSLSGEHDMEYRIVRPDGTVRWIHDRGFPLRNASGTVYRIAGIADDITDRKRVEEQHRRFHEMEALSRIAGSVVHDFNNALETIILDLWKTSHSTPIHPAPPARGGRETILMVEPDASLRRIFGDLLRGRGYHVLEASNGSEALRVWNEHDARIDLLVTDLVMADGLTGRDLLAMLRGKASGLKVVFTSRRSAPSAGHAPEVRAGQKFLEKPCAPHQILEAVRECLDS
jgi:PAS domain S-box-containing protein